MAFKIIDWSWSIHEARLSRNRSVPPKRLRRSNCARLARMLLTPDVKIEMICEWKYESCCESCDSDSVVLAAHTK